MAGNTKQPLGTLNRVAAHVVFSSFPQLNIVPENLAKAGVSLEPQGAVVTIIEAMTGTINSPEPYVQVHLTIALNKTSPVADLFKKQIEQYGVLGDVDVYTDTPALSKYSLRNVSIQSQGAVNTSGTDATFTVTLAGTWDINNSMWV
ncbi:MULTISPECIES: hypothetical protein [Burkholderia]|uniref:Bacteriophage protein n=1 Tax=Burkholderia multivorans TaxID=87883 RepID=A0AB37AV78_9BURK|nr:MULTISPECIES: hypothetical protein [Burkholderia]MBG0863106.1 hypothetical protein [Burkholderia sp. 9779_493]MBU9297541.1 hypothetical protein [Burkholderia multivorans]MBU9308857.1 hypothetical protein [Burkholderia multivorans]MBU9403499.1 hypothetical protein [Burkholderia multivorans]MBU9515825.1 hypothetical protein [Burkholderia multivorans]